MAIKNKKGMETWLIISLILLSILLLIILVSLAKNASPTIAGILEKLGVYG